MIKLTANQRDSSKNEILLRVYRIGRDEREC